MSWRPDSLLEALQAGEQPAFDMDRHGRYRCPNCGVGRHPAVIVDVRALPIPEDWACDVCWTAWQRQGRDIDGQGPVADRLAWRLRWVIAHGAPQDIVERIG